MSRKTVLNQFVLALYTATCMTTIFQILVRCSLTFAHSEDNCLDPEDNQPLKLELLNVIFRHGDRTPDDNGRELYPKDPYLHYNYFPMGLGQLTNNGKNREYELGTMLRKTYNEFLGPIYVPDNVVARSTDYDRTKMSLQLVLASLYRPFDGQTWNMKLDWQPIPINYKPKNLDNLMVSEECPLYLKEYNQVMGIPEVVKRISEYDDLMKNLTDYTGKNITTPLDMFYLYHTFVAETSMNLQLPKWADNIFPWGLLWNATVFQYDINSYNTLLKRLNGGALLRRIIENMKYLTQDKPEKHRKIFLYSGHETNIAALLKTLDVWEPHVPEYSSSIIIELLQSVSNETYYVKVIYYSGIPSTKKELTIPGCNTLCPLTRFLELTKDVVPTEEELFCDKSKTQEDCEMIKLELENEMTTNTTENNEIPYE